MILWYEQIIIINVVERITISLDVKLAEELRIIARREKLSLSKLIAQAVRECVVERKRKEAGRRLLELHVDKDKLEEAEKELLRMRREEWR